jgi:hypothetical protein
MARLHPAAKKRLEQARAKERQSMRNYDTEGTSGSESTQITWKHRRIHGVRSHKFVQKANTIQPSKDTACKLGVYTMSEGREYYTMRGVLHDIANYSVFFATILHF